MELAEILCPKAKSAEEVITACEKQLKALSLPDSIQQIEGLTPEILKENAKDEELLLKACETALN